MCYRLERRERSGSAEKILQQSTSFPLNGPLLKLFSFYHFDSRLSHRTSNCCPIQLSTISRRRDLLLGHTFKSQHATWGEDETSSDLASDGKSSVVHAMLSAHIKTISTRENVSIVKIPRGGELPFPNGNSK